MMYQSFNKLSYGKAYLFKGNSSKLAYLLNNEPNVQILNENDLFKINNYIYLEPTNFVYLLHYYQTLPETLKVPPLARVFILFSVHDSLSDSEKKRFKHYESDCYTTLDYSKFTVKDCEEFNNITKSIKRINSNKYLHYPLVFKEMNSSLFQVNLTTNDNVIYFIKQLTNKRDFRYVKEIVNLKKSILDNYFTPPFSEFRVRIVEDRELTHSIRYWYMQFYSLKNNKELLTVNQLVYLFFTWVYRATVKYNNGYKNGLSKSVNGLKTTYFFTPSKEAADEFYLELIK